MDRDRLGSGYIKLIEFQNVLHRIDPGMSSDIINSIFRDYQDFAGDKCNYKQFLNVYDQYKRRRTAVDKILENLYYKYSSSDSNLFELFEQSDRNQDGQLNEREFLECMGKFGLNLNHDETDNLMFFVDLNADKNVSYKELKKFFDIYLK